jgi:hypothetical protein
MSHPTRSRSRPARLFFALAALVFAAPAYALSYFVSFGGGVDMIGKYPLDPFFAGTTFATADNAQGLTYADGKLYWLEGANVWMQNVDGTGKTLLQTYGVTPTDLAVDAAGGSYFASFGGGIDMIGKYPLQPFFAGTTLVGTNDAHGLTYADGKIYWLEGANVWMQNVDGTGKTLLQTYGVTPTDLAVDAASGNYFASFGGGLDMIGKYPLSPFFAGTTFTGSDDAHGLTYADGKVYWLEGTHVWMQNVDGSGKELLQTFGIAPISLAVETAPLSNPLPPVGVPDPAATGLLVAGALGILATMRGTGRLVLR